MAGREKQLSIDLAELLGVALILFYEINVISRDVTSSYVIIIISDVVNFFVTLLPRPK